MKRSPKASAVPGKTLVFLIVVIVLLVKVQLSYSTRSIERLSSNVPGHTQEQLPRLLKRSSFRNEPMKVIGIKVKGKPIEADKEFVEDDDWLKSLTIRLKNVSDKPVVFIEISLNFPSVEEHPYGPEPGYVYDLSYGRAPQSGLPPKEESKPVLPNQTVDISLTEEDKDTIEKALIQLGFPLHTRYVRMLLRTVMFDDDTMWSAGHILTRDPNDPGTWKVVRPAQNQEAGGVGRCTLP